MKKESMNALTFFYKVCFHTARLWPDKFYVKLQHKAIMGEWPNLDNPQTFQEKIQWLKLYDHNPIYTIMVDKYEAKSFIEERVGKEYVIPTLGIYESVLQIDYGALPNSFVIKTTHDSGTVIVCKDKSELDIKKVNALLTKRLRRNYFYSEREWPYKNVKPRIIVEEMIGKGEKDIMDYKFFCFNGEPKMMFIVSNRRLPGGHKADFFDMEGNHLDVWQLGFENNPSTPQLPTSEVFEKMKSIASVLSKDVPLLRVDLYYVNQKIYVGELTFSDSGGYAPFEPTEYNHIIGNWIKLPK